MPGPEKRIPPRDVNVHANYIKSKLQTAYNQSITQKQAAAIRYKEGTYLEFASAAEHDLPIKSLENITTGIRLLNVREDEENKIIYATVYVPDGKESFFIERVDKYLSTFNETGKAKYNDLISSIDDVRLAFLDAFWLSGRSALPNENPVWCEIWLRVEGDCFQETDSSFIQCCGELGISVNEKMIVFPERMVKLIFANSIQLGELIGRSPFIAEIRRAPELASFFTELSIGDEQAWSEDLLSRMSCDFSNTSICLLDTGINSGHPLLSDATEDDTIQSVESIWGVHDHDGHGTEMAGIALYHNLQDKLISGYDFILGHRIESVKILPPSGENIPDLYGAITRRAIYLAEISRPNINRVACMAITSDKYNTNDGSPTSWSGEVDNITYGVFGEGKRLFFVSAGNVCPRELSEAGYLNANINHSVESPGQAWNAITVGAFNSLINIEDPLFDMYRPVANHGEISPYSSTSRTWDQKWPIKPEILCDGGNMATDGENFSECTDLSLLTTYAKPTMHLFTTTWGTSSATAQASNLAARLISEYPNAWPETIRALLIHSARWTDVMKAQFCVPDTKTKGRRDLLRTCGYGIPNLEAAIQCMNNNVNLVIEAELQPFTKDGMNEMHTHKIPWPREVLETLGSTPATLRVTLSYFIEPGPGEVGWKDKYRYPSCGLRFDVINQNEEKIDFIKRVNVKMRGEDKSDNGEGTSGSEKWFLGSDNRDVGSIHSDFREQNAVDFCDMNYIAVYPVIGWWRERKHLKRYNDKIRYALVISISTPEIGTDLYTPIVTQIETAVQNAVEITISRRGS